VTTGHGLRLAINHIQIHGITIWFHLKSALEVKIEFAEQFGRGFVIGAYDRSHAGSFTSR
jgi:hypothetical protein